MRAQIENTGLEIVVSLSTTGGYNPDAIDDLTTRAVAAYERVVAFTIAACAAADDDEGDS